METTSSDQEYTKLTDDEMNILCNTMYVMEDLLYSLRTVPATKHLRISLSEAIDAAWDIRIENS